MGKIEKIMIAIPCMDQMPVEFVKSLTGLRTARLTMNAFESGSLIYAARDHLCEVALEKKPDAVLWFDSDMLFDSDTLDRMAKHLEDGCDFVTGLCFRRRQPFTPCIWSKIRIAAKPEEREAVEFRDYPENQLFEIEGCGMAAAMVKTEVLEKVVQRYGTAFTPLPGYGEDVSFCIRAKQCGFHLFCDSSIKIGHLGKTVIEEETFREWRKYSEACGKPIG